jgi:hypothetical protein
MVSGRRPAFLLYAQSGGILVFCCFLDPNVCCKEIKDIIWKLKVVNWDCALESESAAHIPTKFKCVKGDFTNLFLDYGYILDVTATWVSWKNRYLSGIKFVDKGKCVDECDICSEIMDLNDLIARMPYIKIIHRNTLSVMQCIKDLEQGFQPVLDGAGCGVAMEIQEPESDAQTLSLPIFKDEPADFDDSDNESSVQMTLLLPMDTQPASLTLLGFPDENERQTLNKFVAWAHQVESNLHTHSPVSEKTCCVRVAVCK